MFNPEPRSVVDGRRFLYDANHTSSHGDSACASCHIFGDFDSLAWDLGDPDGTVRTIPARSRSPAVTAPCDPGVAGFHPMKGPMTTQSLRGMANHGPMHWRGDRTGGGSTGPIAVAARRRRLRRGRRVQGVQRRLRGPARPRAQPLARRRDAGVHRLHPAGHLSAEPDPQPRQLAHRPSSRPGATSTSPGAPTARAALDTFFNCNGCHTLDPDGQRGARARSSPASSAATASYSFENETADLQGPAPAQHVPEGRHVRHVSRAAGGGDPAAGRAAPHGRPDPRLRLPARRRIDTVERFFLQNVFTRSTAPSQSGWAQLPALPPNTFGIPAGDEGMPVRRALEAFMMAFDTNLAPIVGQQVTLTAFNLAAVAPRPRCCSSGRHAGECDLVARGLSVHESAAGCVAWAASSRTGQTTRAIDERRFLRASFTTLRSRSPARRRARASASPSTATAIVTPTAMSWTGGRIRRHLLLTLELEKGGVSKISAEEPADSPVLLFPTVNCSELERWVIRP